ncbi:MAG: M42 family peptidase [Oscillospiraceae bacterium]|jgi:endoglucanase|nr:M42 family peptidase [Oscillospiraceae bacterium]
MMNHLENLCKLNSGSGRENAVREYILSAVGGRFETSVDVLGNLTVVKKGTSPDNGKVMLCAHMDEVALICTAVKNDGTLAFGTVGAISPEVLIGRQVVSESGITGIIGAKAVHNLKADEKEKPAELDDLYIDVGSEDKQYVSPGEYFYFPPVFKTFGENKIMGKAIDDRAGCAVLLDLLLNAEFKRDVLFSFTVQEELGLRGAKVLNSDADFAVVAEATTAADIHGVKEDKRVCELGKGAVVPFMDKGTVYDRALFDMAFALAKENNIPCQTKSVIAGANDAGAVHLSGNGIRTLSVSVPCRYIHSALGVADIADIFAVRDLIKCVTASG